MITSTDAVAPSNDNAPAAPLRTRLMGAGREAIGRAAALLRGGALVAFPTETVYGLGATALDDRAVAQVFEAKGRPGFNPLIVHVAAAQDAEALAHVDDRASHLMQTFWPGALTLVLPQRADSGVSRLATAGLDTIALRCPAHPIAQALIQAAGVPVAAPSANRSGAVSPTTAQHVMESLGGRIPLILAGGRADIGLESTVLDLTGSRPVLLRPGSITQEELTAHLGEIDGPQGSASADTAAAGTPRAPGQLLSHYAPTAPVRLNAGTVAEGEALLTFGPDLRHGPRVRNLSETGDLREAAANLFAMVRDLDRPDVSGIAVVPIPEEGLGVAINDRLRRAAAPRD